MNQGNCSFAMQNAGNLINNRMKAKKYERKLTKYFDMSVFFRNFACKIV